MCCSLVKADDRLKISRMGRGRKVLLSALCHVHRSNGFTSGRANLYMNLS